MLSKNIQISLFNVMKIKAKKKLCMVVLRISRNKQKLFRYHPNRHTNHILCVAARSK